MIAFQSLKFRYNQKKLPLLVTDIASMKYEVDSVPDQIM